MPGINEKILGRLKVHIPGIDEQRDIASEFDAIEASLLDIQLRIEKTKSLKLAALRRAFGGDSNV